MSNTRTCICDHEESLHIWEKFTQHEDCGLCGCTSFRAKQLCDGCGKLYDEHPTLDVTNMTTLYICQERAPRWEEVRPGDTLLKGQPYRVEYAEDFPVEARPEPDMTAQEGRMDRTSEAGIAMKGTRRFLDSTWKPPNDGLPTEACVIDADLGNGRRQILFGHPNPGEDGGMTFCRALDGLGYKASEIKSFEVLWTDE